MIKQPAYLLGIETSGITCAVGIANNDQLLIELAAGIKNIHSRVLSRFVNEAGQIAGIEAGDLAGVVVSAGPGSFTGLRIGYSVAKGVAHALQKPIIEVPTLDVWAYQTGAQSMPVLSVIDAHRGEIFAALFVEKQCVTSRKRIRDAGTGSVAIILSNAASGCRKRCKINGSGAAEQSAEWLAACKSGGSLSAAVGAAFPRISAISKR
ncbi:MAG: tRNA (adenosine(37)-N6)-threonylcarbamoyltransferase complex dimerization subunit type 1 TsaB [Calditrichia bacterium]